MISAIACLPYAYFIPVLPPSCRRGVSGRCENVLLVAAGARLGRALEGDDRILRRIAHDGDIRLLATLDALDLLFQHAAEHDDAAIGRAQCFGAAIEHRTLCFPHDAILTVESHQL